MTAKRRAKTVSQSISQTAQQPQDKDTPLSFLDRINRYANLIVGAATILLVVVTAIYIYLSCTIARETKRLADISVKQFKVKSYPTFLITRSNPTYTEGRYRDTIEIHNKGEISSHETSFLILYAITTQEQQETKALLFTADWTHVYRDKDTGNIDVLDYSKKIPANSWTSLGVDIPARETTINNLQYELIFIRYRVPYDPLFSYEIDAFAWEVKKADNDPKQGKFHWETLPDSRRDMLVKQLFASSIKAPQKEKKIEEFFKDYPGIQPLKFCEKEGEDASSRPTH